MSSTWEGEEEQAVSEGAEGKSAVDIDRVGSLDSKSEVVTTTWFTFAIGAGGNQLERSIKSPVIISSVKETSWSLIDDP